MLPDLPDTWKTLLHEEFGKEYFHQLNLEIGASYLINEPPIYPPIDLLYQAFASCTPAEVRVVILGQDPYHGAGQATGLAFAVPSGTKIPPSLQNIYKELVSDTGCTVPHSGDLSHWATQGVLLLNTTLTVEQSAPASHQGKGWEQFTDQVISKISNKQNNVVFILWGKHAASKQSLIDTSKHLILTAPHPSPLSAHRGFFGCRHFSQTNEYLKNHSIKEIEWNVALRKPRE